MRIVHISDLHLRHHLPGTASLVDRKSRQMVESFALALQQIRRLSPDLLVLSGDLLDYPPLEMDYPESMRQGEQDLLMIRREVEHLSVPYVVVCGNHDHPGLIHKVFGHIAKDRLVQKTRILTFDDQEGEGHVPHRTGSERMRFLEALEDTDGPPQIHVQHYVVWPPRNGEYPYSYGEASWLYENITACGCVRLVLSGHYHPGIPPFLDKGVYFATAPGFAEPPHAFMVYDIDDLSLTSERYVLDPTGDA